MKHFIHGNTKSPNIGFGSILMQEESFRAHVNGASDADILEGFVILNGKPKISNFGDTGIGHKYIGRFKISVNNVSLIQIKQTLVQLVDDASDILFVKILIVKDHFLKISAAVVLGDDVAIILALKYIQAPDDIVVVQLFKNGHFILEQLLGYFRSQRIEFDNFDCHIHACILINSFEYLAKIALAYLIRKTVKIIFNFFTVLGNLVLSLIIGCPAEHFNFNINLSLYY